MRFLLSFDPSEGFENKEQVNYYDGASQTANSCRTLSVIKKIRIKNHDEMHRFLYNNLEQLKSGRIIITSFLKSASMGPVFIVLFGYLYTTQIIWATSWQNQ